MPPFTLILLSAILIAGVWSKTHLGVLSKEWIEKIGFAPNDLWVGRFERVISSTFFTDSRSSLIQALVMTLIAVGVAEEKFGTLRTILTFWGVHVVALVLLSLAIVLPLHRLRISFGAELALVRDVGPSAGYFGCFGLLIFLIPSLWRWICGTLIFIGLIFFYLLPAGAEKNPSIKKHADLAHIIGFSAGVLSGFL